MGFGQKLGDGMLVKGLATSPSFNNYDMPNTQSLRFSSFGHQDSKKNPKRETIISKIHNKNPGPGEYIHDVIERPKSHNVFYGKGNKLVDKKLFYLGRPQRGSIYEDPTKDNPDPTTY